MADKQNNEHASRGDGTNSTRPSGLDPAKSRRVRRNVADHTSSSGAGRAHTRPSTRRTEVGSDHKVAGKRKPTQRATSSAPKVKVGTGVQPGQTTLWTKTTPKKKTGKTPSGSASSVFGTIGRALWSVITFIGQLFALLLTVIAKSRVAIAVCIVGLLFALGFVADLGMNWGKVYPGVSVGSVDLGGKTTQEAEAILEDIYAARLTEKEILIFANNEVASDIEQAIVRYRNNALAEQQSVEEALANKVLWTASADSLSASLDTQDLIAEALSVGREGKGLIDRFEAQFFGHDIEPRAAYDDGALERLAAEIDAAIGLPRINFDIKMYDGTAWVTDGRDGDMVNREDFRSLLDTAFLSDDTDRATFVARTEYAPIQITRDEAERVSDLVNRQIAPGASFSYGGTIWEATATDLGAWIKTRIVPEGGDYRLEPYFDQSVAKGIVLNHLKANFDGDTLKVTFEIVDGEQKVHTDTEETIPLAGDAVFMLNEQIFGPDHVERQEGQSLLVEVGSQHVPDTMSLDDALDNGIVSPISSFTTEYTVEPTERQHNIHLASDLISNSIIKADGGTWSFNETAGNCNEEAGFQSAGAIVGGEFVDAVGGGICQVATTIFNSVYDSGFPVLTRHNHSLHIASYPAGRDAAVSWPDLDFVWENDSTSDALLIMTYSDTSVTATIYGVNPEYQVTTQVGEWQEGKQFKTQTTTDRNLTPGSSYVKTVGSDGRNITIVRSVKDKNGTLLHEDVFSSTYDPKDEVKVQGPTIDGGQKSEEGDTTE